MLRPYPGLSIMIQYEPFDTSILEELLQCAGQFCTRQPTRQHLKDYVTGLLANIPRHNTWQMAEFAQHGNPFIYQNLLCRAVWDQDATRTAMIHKQTEFFHGKPYSLIVDETGFLKKGTHSCGVQRQYSGTAGRVENCQIGVFLACATQYDHCLLDARLYLPESWTSDTERCAKAGVPADIQFHTKIELAQEMMVHALNHGMKPEWALADSVYGDSSAFRMALQEHRLPYVLGVSSCHYVWRNQQQQKASEIISDVISKRIWKTLGCGAGSKGARLYQWCLIPINDPGPEGWSHGLLLRKPRRSEAAKDIAAFRCCAPPEMFTLQELVRAAGQRWAIETCFEESKQLLGMDQYEVRSWTSWYRHMTLVILAHDFLAMTKAAQQKKQHSRT